MIACESFSGVEVSACDAFYEEVFKYVLTTRGLPPLAARNVKPRNSQQTLPFTLPILSSELEIHSQ